MKISKKVKYGFKALAYIAIETSKGRMVRIKEISEKENISIQYLEQILYRLKNKKIIEGKRGPSGGYKLIIDPTEVTLYEIYIILDEDPMIINCNEAYQNKRSIECIDKDCSCIWKKLDDKMKEILEAYTIKDIINNRNII